MTAWPQLALAYNREIRTARRRARVETAAKLLIAMALGLGLAAGTAAAFAEIVAVRASFTSPWKG